MNTSFISSRAKGHIDLVGNREVQPSAHLHQFEVKGDDPTQPGVKATDRDRKVLRDRVEPGAVESPGQNH